MMEQGKDLIQAIQALEKTVERINGNNSTATIQVNAGGVGVWVATTCAVVMLACLFVGGFWVMREFNRLDTELGDRKAENESMRSYLSVIYQQLPSLREHEKKESK